MTKLSLHVIGKIKGPAAELYQDYAKRMLGGLTLRELSGATQKAEGQALLASLPDKAFVVLLDERGKDLTSRELAAHLTNWQEQGPPEIVFIIGGADGVIPEVKERANFLLGMGKKTWPHRLVRVMLAEQLYRAQQINQGHPYHRD